MSLFPVKVRELLDDLKTSGAFDFMVKMTAAVSASMPASHLPQSLNDNKTRLVVSSEQLHQAVLSVFAAVGDGYQMRIAVPSGVTKLFVPEATMFEIYAGRDCVLAVSVALPYLPDAVADALELELREEVSSAQKRKSLATA